MYLNIIIFTFTLIKMISPHARTKSLSLHCLVQLVTLCQSEWQLASLPTVTQSVRFQLFVVNVMTRHGMLQLTGKGAFAMDLLEAAITAICRKNWQFNLKADILHSSCFF